MRERRRRRVADVEAAAVDGVPAGPAPVEIASGLIVQIPTGFGDAVGEREREGGVVGPLARRQIVRTAVAIADDRVERSKSSELDRRAERVADGESQQASATAVEQIGNRPTPRCDRGASRSAR